MSAILFIGDYTYSSWSLRAWLLFERFGLHVATRVIPFIGQDVAKQMASTAPSRTVPTWTAEDGAVLWDSLAIAEELAQRNPGAGHWPADPGLRATARSLAAEMHSGFAALREACPMNLRRAYTDHAPSADVLADLRRLESIWEFALRQGGGPWLCGRYSVADAFFAPVAARIAGYGLVVGPEARAYVDRHLHDQAFRRWRAMALVHGPDLPWYARDHTQGTWPGPVPLPAEPQETNEAENATCPFSGRPVSHFARIEGRTIGFCNAFCRDKAVADPAAWSEVMALIEAPAG